MIRGGIDETDVVTTEWASKIARDGIHYLLFREGNCILEEFSLAIDVLIKRAEDKKIAHKIKSNAWDVGNEYYCSSCEKQYIVDSDNFCSNCGAKFEEGVE